MSVDFSSETTKARRKLQIIFQVLKEERCQPGMLLPSKNILWKWGGNQDTLRQKKAKRLYHQQTHPQSMVKDSSQNRKRMIREEILEHQERNNWMSKNGSTHNRLSFS